MIDIKFKTLLDENYSWPCTYGFKFIVPVTKESELLLVVGKHPGTTKRHSKTGKYVSYSIPLLMNSAAEVLDLYKKAKALEGVIAL